MNDNQITSLFGIPRREWSRKGGSFNVQVVNHLKDVSALQSIFEAGGIASDDGGQRWNVYAFIFPVHPLFAKLDPESDSWSGQEVISAMPFHYGASYLRRHFNEKGELSCYQIGSDYNHLHDEFFTRAVTTDDAWQVFKHACDLFDHLEAIAKPGYGPGAAIRFDRGSV